MQDGQLIVETIVSAASTDARTYKVRCGADTGSVYLNGDNSARKFGGVAKSTLSVIELSA